MRIWDPLNERQLSLLGRLGMGEDVDFAAEGLVNTLVALRSRGLVKAARRRGRWSAQLADAGHFYLKHGHHPERPPAGRSGNDSLADGCVDDEPLPARRTVQPIRPRPGASVEHRRGRAHAGARGEPDLGAATATEMQQLYRGLDVPKLAFSLGQAAVSVGVSAAMLSRAIRGVDAGLPVLRAKLVGDRYLVPAVELLRWIQRLPDA